MRRFEYRDQKSNKFWQIDQQGSEVTTQWGRIGTDGQSKTKAYATAAKAQADVDKQILSKQGKGYVESDDASMPMAAAPAPATAAATTAPASATVAPAPATVAPATTDPLPDGAEASVKGSGSSVYTLRNVGGVYSCTCPAWRNQSLAIDRRTCKHLRNLRGEAAEHARLQGVGATLPQRAVVAADAPALLLAHRWEQQDPTGWWMSEKLDGVRAYWDGKGFVSRLGNGYLAPAWFTEGLPNFPLDGELFAGRGRFAQAVSIARRADAGEAWRSLSFVIFDGPGASGGFEARIAELEEHFRASPWAHASVLAHRVCTGLADLNAELKRVEALGGEGLMLRKPGSAYVAGRSDTLLKVKTFLDTEARIVGYQPGTGRHKGRLGALMLELPNGTRFKVGTGLSDAERDNPPAVGEIITVRYQELTDAGVPRFPSYIGVRGDFDWDAAVAAGSD
ncbi:DNA ligase [Enhygromyxa salina]|uniref:DNA ligase n=1 Tax=Enhygromyxa salina TaxID=215803 RepID=A0A2S9XQ24_9BACT|nr:DNA ligase [Enhygromyxa salina]PRP94850.1 DNA ligase [Enhygromyxa salina]